MIDISIVLIYFIIVFVVALSGKIKNPSTEEYFLSSRNLKWYSIAFSTIATNIQGNNLLGMMGSAYLFGLAQATLEIDAIQGLLMAAFIFVPLFLREKIFTVSQFIKKRISKSMSYAYSFSYLIIYSTITLGAALFWGAYATDIVFTEELSIISNNRITRISVIIIILGFLSFIYSYLGGLSAVVRTDIIQFSILTIGGLAILFVTIKNIGGWENLYVLTPEKMHLHLPSDHEVLPWTHILGLFFLNINYWCGNQMIIQRALAAKNLGHAQTGLLVGGILKYLMAIMIVIPGIALFAYDQSLLSEPDMAFPFIVKNYIPIGLKGIILCGLFASVMSTVDSTYNSIATIWSIDIYSTLINKKASSKEKVNAGKSSIILSLITGLTMGMIFLYMKFNNPEAAFTHTTNELRYLIFTSIIVLICSSIILIKPKAKSIMFCFLICIPINLMIKIFVPEINYFFRIFIVCSSVLGLAILLNRKHINSFKNSLQFYSPKHKYYGITLLLSLILVHIIFN